MEHICCDANFRAQHLGASNCCDTGGLGMHPPLFACVLVVQGFRAAVPGLFAHLCGLTVQCNP
jgi:hypothetical protein